VPTQEKVATVEELKTRLRDAKTVVLTEYRGLTVQQLSDLRKQLRAVSAQYKVVKNRLARLAVSSSDLQVLSAHLTGPTGLVVSREDPVALAKALATFMKGNQALTIKAGYVDGQPLDAAGLKTLADLPSRDALRAQLAGVLQGPLTGLVGLLAAPQRELVYVLAQRGRASRAGGAGEASEEVAGDRASRAGGAGKASGEMGGDRASRAGDTGEASGEIVGDTSESTT
jgi:large subunit ribosomal protein L10